MTTKDVYIRLAPWPRDPFEILTLVGPRFPLAFEHATPLAIGIHRDFARAFPDITSEEIGLFFDWWCNAPRYLANIARSGAVRRNLHGRPVEPVSGADRMIAATRLVASSNEDVVVAINNLAAMLSTTAPLLAAPGS